MVNYTDPNQITDCRVTDTPWHGRTASGYGGAIPTRYMVKYANRWYRVRAMAFGNSGSPYITVHGEDLHIDIETEYRLREEG